MKSLPILALFFSSLVNAHHTIYSPDGGWLSQANPSEATNICLLNNESWNSEYKDVLEQEAQQGYPRCTQFDLGGAFKLQALNYADWDHNIAEACRIKTEYLNCNYPDVITGLGEAFTLDGNPYRYSCGIAVSSQLFWGELLQRDWCGEYQDILDKREKFKKIAPLIYQLIFN